MIVTTFGKRVVHLYLPNTPQVLPIWSLSCLCSSVCANKLGRALVEYMKVVMPKQKSGCWLMLDHGHCDDDDDDINDFGGGDDEEV